MSHEACDGVVAVTALGEELFLERDFQPQMPMARVSRSVSMTEVGHRMKRITWVHLVALVVLSAGTLGCQDSEPPSGSPLSTTPTIQQPAVPQNVPVDIPRIEGGGVTRVPEAVKGKWKAIVLSVEDKQQQKMQDYTIALGTTFAIPDSDLNIEVLDFLPDMKIENSVFTSASNALENPAIHVVITEGEKEIFDGWLFSLFPTIHPFQHQRYGVTLREAVPS